MPRLMSPRETAQVLSISVEAVRRLARLGKIRAIRIGMRRVAIPEDALREYIESRPALATLSTRGEP